MTFVMTGSGILCAVLFLCSGVFWIISAQTKHPGFIDCGMIGDPTEPKDWFWAYRRAGLWSAKAAWFAVGGGAFGAFAEIARAL